MFLIISLILASIDSSLCNNYYSAVCLKVILISLFYINQNSIVRKCCPYSPFIYVFIYMHECLDTYFILCIIIQYFHFKNYILVLHDIPGSSRIFLTPASDSTISLRIHGSFLWRIFREDPGPHMLTMTRVSLILACLRTEVGHTPSHICIYEFAYIRKHGFIWISLTPVKEKRVHSSLFLSLSVTAYPTARNQPFITYNILVFIYSFNLSIHKRSFQNF